MLPDPLDPSEFEAERERQFSMIADAIDEVADTWWANYQELGRDPCNYWPHSPKDPGYGWQGPYLDPAVAGSTRMRSLPYVWHDLRDLDEEEEEDRDPPRFHNLILQCGPGKHFCLTENIFEYNGTPQLELYDDYYGVWFASSGLSGIGGCEQLRELAQAARDGLWLPMDDNRPRTDEQGRTLYDYRGRKYLFNEEGKPFANNGLDLILGKPEDFA